MKVRHVKAYDLMAFPIFGRRRRKEAAEHGIESSMSPVSPRSPLGVVGPRAVFDRIDTRCDDRIDVNELATCLEHLNVADSHKKASKLLWEVDEDMDGFIGWEEFETMYSRTADDPTGNQPRKLYNLVEFMMADGDANGSLTFGEAFLHYTKRFGKQLMDRLISKLFSEEEANNPESQISFSEYCQRDKAILDERRQTSHQRLQGSNRPSVRCSTELAGGFKRASIEDLKKSSKVGNRASTNPRDYPLYGKNFRTRRR